MADCQFYRQRIIGKWIVDFYCPKAKLVIEIDGAQHLEDIGIERDRQRDHHLQRLGLTVVRFLDDEIFNHLDEVLEKIYIFLSRNNPPFVKGD